MAATTAAAMATAMLTVARTGGHERGRKGRGRRRGRGRVVVVFMEKREDIKKML
jgi:hypothetical protein